MMSKLLLLSNSTMPGTAYFSWPEPWVKKFLGPVVKEVVFIPYAAVTFSYDAYFNTVSRVFEKMGYTLKSVHQALDKNDLINRSQAIVVGGGNTFALLSRMYQEDLLLSVKSKVTSGTPYIGWSAGANLACTTIKTTNDMPVVMPPSLEGLNLIPFQINPHYHELKFENQGGETRKERLEEFLCLNQHARVIGLPEGMLIERNGNCLKILGNGTAKLFEYRQVIREYKEGSDVSFLLENPEG